MIDDPQDPQATDDAIARGEAVFFVPPDAGAIEGEIVEEPRLERKLRRMQRDFEDALDDAVLRRYAEDIDARFADPPPPWVPTGVVNDRVPTGIVFTAPVGTPEPLDLGDVTSMSFGTPAPQGALIRTRLEGGSPVLDVGGRPVAWFENWLRNREGRS